MGALILVPLLTGLDPSVALFTAGVGTLIFQIVTRGKIPVFLGSSFAFIPATIYGVQTWGIPPTLCGLASAGLVYGFMSLLVSWRGPDYINRILPPIITGPVIITIGLVLAPAAINMAMGKSGDGSIQIINQNSALLVAFVSLVATVITRLFAKGRLKLIPILVGVLVGYVAASIVGIVDMASVLQSNWIQAPKFILPQWHWPAILMIMPIAVVASIEHIGDIAAISAVTKRNYIKSPGLHRSLLGDGIATTVAACVGGPPNITYAEVTAGVAITKIYNPAIMTWASIAAILLAFIGKVNTLLQTIPSPVMGGIMTLLFGAIAVTGLNILVQSQEDLMKPRAMTIVGIILVIPIGGLSIGAGSFAIGGIGLAGIVGVLLNILLPAEKDKELIQAA